MSKIEEARTNEQALAALDAVLNDIETQRRSEGDVAPSQDGWGRARDLVKDFKPVPWFIWRIGAVCFASSGTPESLPEGLFLGLKKLVLRAAADPLMGAGASKSSLRGALKSLDGSAVAAICIIHALNRRIQANETVAPVIGPLLDNALTQAQIGYVLGKACPGLTPGRGMLAGYLLKIGLPVLMALGTSDAARRSLTLLAEGKDAEEVGRTVYGCGALQFTSLLASLIGAGADAARGMVSFANQSPLLPKGPQARVWYSAYRLIPHIGQESLMGQPDFLWDELGVLDPQGKHVIQENARAELQKPCSWEWLL